MTTKSVETTASEVDVDAVDVSSVPWVAHGILAGVLGAFAIAAFFFVLDLGEGRPFATPHALGSAFFLGKLPEPGVVEGALVAGYTVMHGTIFVFLGLTAAFAALSRRRSGARSFLHALLVWLALFVACQAIFLGIGGLFMPGALGELGAGSVAVANLLAAGVMAGFLELRARAGPALGSD